MLNAINYIGEFLLKILVFIIGAIGVIEAAIRTELKVNGVDPQVQNVIIIATTVLLIVAAYRVVGGLIGILITVLLLLLVVHVAAPDLLIGLQPAK